jgi:hypothetical protein
MRATVVTAGILVPNRRAAADVETRRCFHGRLFLVVAIAHQRRRDHIGLPQNRLAFDAAHRHVRTQVQRIAHRVSARSNLDSAAAERRDVVHRGLQRAVVRADQVRVRLADGDARLLLHRGMHSLRELPFVNRWREVFGGSASRGRLKKRAVNR